MSKRNLLSKTTNSILLFMVMMLLIAAPLIYFATNWLYIQETDETLLLQKEEFFEHELPNFKQSDIVSWNYHSRNVKIIPDRKVRRDSLFYITYFDKLENENEPYRELNAPIPIEGNVYTYSGRINLIEIEDMILSIALIFVVLIIVLLGGMLLITRRLSKKLWAPFYKALTQIEEFDVDKNNTTHFEETDISEFDSLNKNLQRVFERNTRTYQNQAEFIENAAHELQTPLALFQSKVDTLSQSSLSASQSELVNKLHSDIARLKRLNKNLLLLSKIDNDLYGEKELVHLQEYIEKPLPFFTEQASANAIKITTFFEADATVFANSGILEIMINNLFLNAVRHNIENGKIAVTVSENRLVFSNTSTNQKLNIDQLYGRFSKSSASQGHGLGLAIIKKIVHQNNWKIEYSYTGGMHHFSIIF